MPQMASLLRHVVQLDEGGRPSVALATVELPDAAQEHLPIVRQLSGVGVATTEKIALESFVARRNE
jgi:hypothetical protein